MERSRTMKKWDRGMENMEIWNGTVPHNTRYGNLEWNGPKQWKKWDTGMERSRTMEKMGYGNGTIPNNGKKWDTGMKRSRTMEKMG